MKTPFLHGAYQARSGALACDRMVNLYPEAAPQPPGKDVGALFGCPGHTLRLTLANAPVRALLAANDLLYAVGGTRLYEISANWIATDRGEIPGVGQISMAENGLEIVFCTGHRYVFSTATLSAISGAAFSNGCLQFSDGYFLANIPNTGQIQISGLYDGSSWDSLDFATAEGSPDNVIGHIADHREWWVFGERSVEVYTNTGAADFPFERVSGGFIETGCAARATIKKMDNSVFWLSQDDRGTGIVYRAEGYQPQRISTHAIEYAIAGYSSVSDAFAFTYQQEGHSFYVLVFPTGDATWVFDASTQLWHERAYRNADNSLSRIRANCYAFFNGHHVIGDHTTGAITTMDLDVYDDAGNARKWLRSFRVPSTEGKRARFNSLQIDLQAGVGLDGTAQGTDPQTMLRWSDDGGNTWSSEHWADMGRIGEYSCRAIWRRLGMGRDRVFEVSGTDPVKVALVSSWLEAEALAS